MKSTKFLIPVVLFGSAIMFGSCSGSAKKEAEKEAKKQVQTVKAVVIAEELKKECVEIYNQTASEQNKFIENLAEMKSELADVPVKFFMPLNVAGRAQTLWQKAQVLGFYNVDRNVDKFLFGGNNGNAEREASMLSLATDLNLSTDFINGDELNSDNRAETLQKINDFNTQMFAKALDNDNAQFATVSMAYSIIESTICKIGLAKLWDDEVDQQKIFNVVIEQMEMLRNFTKLYTTLKPYYDSLSPLEPLVQKIQKVANADKGTELDNALYDYISYANEMRDHVLTEFNLVVK